jgi:hypothetical protein
MNPSDLLDALELAISAMAAGRARLVSSTADRNRLRSFVGAWFGQYRPEFEAMLGEQESFARFDEMMQRIVHLATESPARRTVLSALRAARQEFSDSLLGPLTRAHWSKAPQRAPAGRDAEVAARLKKLERSFAESYEQVVLDLDDDGRISYRGPGAELRELLTGVLHTLAPNAEVQATSWYKEARRTGARKEPTPTRAERTRFILANRGKGSAATETAESYTDNAEERLGRVVSATYARGSAVTHSAAERAEVSQVLRYVNALFLELLPP